MSLLNQVNLLIFQLLSFQRVPLIKMFTEALFEHNLPILIIMHAYNL